MKIWAITDDRMGNNNQVVGVAEALKMPFEIKKIAYDKWIKVPNFLRGSSLLGIEKSSRKEIDLPREELPDLVIGAGRRMFPLLCYIKAKSGGRTKIVQMMNPGFGGLKRADLVVLPKHDNYKGHAKNVFEVLGAPHRVTDERLNEERAHWRPVFEKYPQARISVIVGGATKKAPFTEEMSHNLGASVLAMRPASILVSTSRRTPSAVVDVLQKIFPKEKTFFYRFGDSGENPYFGLLAWGNKIVVTGDSMSMCSEACATGSPVYIFAPRGTMSKKHMLFHQELYQAGYASSLESGITAFGGRLNASAEIAQNIKKTIITQLQKTRD